MIFYIDFNNHFNIKPSNTDLIIMDRHKNLTSDHRRRTVEGDEVNRHVTNEKILMLLEF